MKTLKILYDGRCHICYKEIQMYKKRDKKNLLVLIDITQDGFDASDYGLTEKEVNDYLYTIDDSGEMYKGVDSFIEIWKRVPPYHRLIPLFNNFIIKPPVKIGYHVFAMYIRPNLPKRSCKL